MTDRTHKGLPITFDETDEVWRCRSIDAKHESLSKLKKAIDAWDRKVRKPSAIPAYTLESRMPKVRRGHSRGQGDPGASFVATEIVQYLGLNRYGRKIKVAAMPENGARRTYDLETLVKATPENEAILARANEIAGRIWPVLNQFWMVLEELEYLTEEDVSQLREIAERNAEDLT